MYIVNGKEATQEEVKEMLNNPDLIVESISMQTPDKGGADDRPMTNEGFTLDAEDFSLWSSSMDRYNAGLMSMAFENSRKLMGKSVYITIVSPGYVPKWKMFIWNLLRKML